MPPRARKSKRAEISETKEEFQNREEIEILLEKASSIGRTRGNWYVHEGIKHLMGTEPRFLDLFLKYELPTVYTSEMEGSTSGGMPTVDSWSDPPFVILTQIIVHQQLSGASAKSVWNKFLSCFDLTESRLLTPEMIKKSSFNLITDEDGKRKMFLNNKPSGLSASKANYIQSLADAFLDDSHLKSINWVNISDEDLTAKLIAVKGLGIWSVHMFMMFALHRPNILPLGDLGIRRGLCNFLGHPKGYLEDKKNLKSIESLSISWAPYCSLASFYLWRHSEVKLLSDLPRSPTKATQPAPAEEEEDDAAPRRKKARKG
jgi:3-methyladenine DNA glycosylase/8-oxoguanine DNA glycosylase